MSGRLDVVPYEKRFKSIVPIARPAGLEPLTELGGADEHQDHAVARWLARESFENTAAEKRLELVEYSERLFPVDELPPDVAEQLGAAVHDFDWFEFEGLGRLNQAQFDWFEAEFIYHCEQWLEAEREFYNQWLEAEHAWRQSLNEHQGDSD